jgi:hypothetical protein
MSTGEIGVLILGAEIVETRTVSVRGADHLIHLARSLCAIPNLAEVAHEQSNSCKFACISG